MANLDSANNLSDVDSIPTSVANLGLTIGTNTQAYSARLTKLATAAVAAPAAGDIGELVSASIAAGSAVGVSSGSFTNVVTLTLQPGVWDVEASVTIFPTGGSSLTVAAAGINDVTATAPASNESYFVNTATQAASSGYSQTIGTTRYVVSSGTKIVYLVAAANSTGGSDKAYGKLEGRRVA